MQGAILKNKKMAKRGAGMGRFRRSQERRSENRREHSYPGTGQVRSKDGDNASTILSRGCNNKGRAKDLISSLDLNDENEAHRNSILAMS